ncbi:MAG: hypothetical protein RL456_1864 [Pseudomonadota bacterium]|jgi:hypothetical protein
MKPLRASAIGALIATLARGAIAEPAVPKPYVVAPICTPEQRESAISVVRPAEPLIACYFLQKWSFKGAAVAVQPEDYAEREVSDADFYQLRKKVFREQSARLRTERDMKEALPGEPPPHAGMPRSLFVRARTPLGVFLNESKHIGFADLVPVAAYNDQVVTHDRYPLIQLVTFVHVKSTVVKLIQVAPITGPGTVAEGFIMADDWARRLNGGERLATGD